MKTKKDAKSKGTILIADYDFGDVNIERAIIEGAGFEILAAQCKSEDEVIEHGRDADGVLAQYAPIGASAINAFTRCRVIARYGTGVDIVDVNAATRRGIQVTNAPNEWCAEEVADHAVARSGSLLPARSANTTGQSGKANGAGRRVTLSGASVGAFSASYPSVQSHAASRNA
jgi:phosphoglycerate dehydrogenase-like enzyme